MVDIDKLKSEQGANITYLRTMARTPPLRVKRPHLAAEIERACDDIEAYREIMGFLLKANVPEGLNKEDRDRFERLVAAMTWGNG